MGSERGICKSVIRSGRLNVKLPNPLRLLDQHHMTQIKSLHDCTERSVYTRYVATVETLFVGYFLRS
jgi:hypothetical protein